MSLFSFIQVCAACLRLSNCLFLGLGTDQCRRPLKQTEFYTVYPPSFGIMTPLCLEISWICFGFCIFLLVLLPWIFNEWIGHYLICFSLSCCCFFWEWKYLWMNVRSDLPLVKICWYMNVLNKCAFHFLRISFTYFYLPKCVILLHDFFDIFISIFILIAS